MPRLTEARLQAALSENQLVFSGTNQNQHRVYADGQQPACPHREFTDSSASHPGFSHLTSIRRTREEIDECKAVGPCSGKAPAQEEKRPPSREDSYRARVAKREKTPKSKNNKRKGKHFMHTAMSRLPGLQVFADDIVLCYIMRFICTLATDTAQLAMMVPVANPVANAIIGTATTK